MTEAAIRRLVILKALAASSDYRRSDVLLQQAVIDVGLSASLAVVRSDLLYLEEQGVLSVTEQMSLKIALLNQRGLDVANGVAHVEGVAKPLPEV